MSTFLGNLALGADTLLLGQAQALRTLYVQHLKKATEIYTAAVMDTCIRVYEYLSDSINDFKQGECGGAHAADLLAARALTAFADQALLLDFADHNYVKSVLSLCGPDSRVLLMGHQELGARMRGHLKAAIEEFLQKGQCTLDHGVCQDYGGAVAFGDGWLAKGEGGCDEGYGTGGSHNIDSDAKGLFDEMFFATDELVAEMQVALEDILDRGHSEGLLADEGN